VKEPIGVLGSFFNFLLMSFPRFSSFPSSRKVVVASVRLVVASVRLVVVSVRLVVRP